jgi:hypothetical protein
VQLATGFKGKLGSNFWEIQERYLNATKAHLVLVRRFYTAPH